MNRDSFVRLGDVLEGPPRRGAPKRHRGYGQSLPFVDTRLVREGPTVLTTPPTERVFGQGRNRLTREGDLLLIGRGVREDRRVRCAVIAFAEPAGFSASLTRVRVDASYANAHYVCLYFTSQQGRRALLAASTGTVVNNLTPSSLAEIEIRLPSLSEQEAIVDIMTRLERQMIKVERARGTLKATHETLREGLITGALVVSEPLEGHSR